MIPRLGSTVLSLLALASPASPQCSVLFELEPGTAPGNPIRLTAGWGNTLFFTGRHALGSELFRWDPGNGAGLLKDILPGSAGSSPEELTVCCTAQGPRLFFSAVDSTTGRELWSSDGTTAGTQPVADIRPGRNSSVPGRMAAVDGRVFLAADDGTHGIELWLSDGTAAGTSLVKDILPGAFGSSPADLHAVNGRVVFTAFEQGVGRRVYVSDGTDPGTFPLWPVAPGPTILVEPILWNGRLYFGAQDAATGLELWATDGTTGGTVLVADLRVGAGSSSPSDFCVFRGELWFAASHNGFQRELFKTDGTTAGTVRVTNLGGSSLGLLPRDLTSSNGLLFFSGEAGVLGRELFVSDGTQAGTLAIDVHPTSSSTPHLLVPTGRGVCFRAESPNGRELWFSDGTPAGTTEVCDLDPGPAHSDPDQLVVCHGRLFFSATTPTTGREVFWLPTPGATLTNLGTGSLPSRPTLAIADDRAPVQGTSIDVVARGPAQHLGVLFLGLPLAQPPIPGLMRAGCDWVGLLTANPIPLVVSAQPSLGATLNVPTQPFFVGVALHLQAWWLDPAATPPVQVSNGVQMVIGGGAPS